MKKTEYSFFPLRNFSNNRALYVLNILIRAMCDMVKHELRVESLKARVKIQKC